MLTVQINPLVHLEMDTEHYMPGVADGVAVLKTNTSTFSCPFRLVVNSDTDVAVNPIDILAGVEDALTRQGLGIKVASIKVATRE